MPSSKADTCTGCDLWRAEYIELEQLYHKEKNKAHNLVMEAHVAKTLHRIAVGEREDTRVELEKLKLRIAELEKKQCQSSE